MEESLIPPEAKAMIGSRLGRQTGVIYAKEAQRFAAAVGDLNPLYFDDVSVGDEIPSVTETATEIQMFFFSAATNNAHRIHYDLPYAKSEGLATILVHGPLQAALLAKTLTDWIGPAGRLARIQIQNRGSAFPHEKLAFGGVVTHKREENGQFLVECDIFERNEQGEVIMPGSATLSLPRRPA